jgi:hypothetical protein
LQEFKTKTEKRWIAEFVAERFKDAGLPTKAAVLFLSHAPGKRVKSNDSQGTGSAEGIGEGSGRA